MPQNLTTANLPALLVLMVVVLAILGAWTGVVLRFAFGLPFLPPNTPRVVPWGPGSVLLAILLWLGLQIGVTSLYLSAKKGPEGEPSAKRPDLSPGETMTLSAVQNTAVLVLVPLALFAISGARSRDYGIDPSRFARQARSGMIAYPLLAPVVFGAMAAAVLYWGKTNHPLENAILGDKSPGMIAILVLAGVILAPAAEELIFRGVLLGWLTRVILEGRRKPSTVAELAEIIPELPREPDLPTSLESSIPQGRAGPLFVANVVVSIIFAGLHASVWPTPIPIFFLSLGLGLLYQRTGSLVTSTALHMTFNGVSTLLMLLTLGMPKPDEPIKRPDPAKAVKVVAAVEVSAKIDERLP